MQQDIKQLLELSSRIIAPFLTVLIAYLSLTTMEGIPIEMDNKDKFLHGLAYFTLAFFWLFAVKKSQFSILARGIVVFLVISYGILIEYAQGTFTDYRMFDLMDVVANTIGTVLAIVFFTVILSVFKGGFNSK